MMKAKMARVPGTMGGSGGAPSGGLRVRSRFLSTPLFKTVMVNGERRETWKLPDNTGKFELRAYAVSPAHEFGGGSTAQQVARRPVTLTPSIPRVARVGDQLRCGVTVTAAEDVGQLRVTLALGAVAPISLASTGLGESLLTLSAGQTKEVVFPLVANRVGNFNATVSVSGMGRELDKLQLRLPVLGTQPEVMVATSMALPASSEEAVPWEEGLALPAAENGTGHLTLVAGLGRLAAVQNMVTGLLQLSARGSTDAPATPELLAALASSALLAPYTAAKPELVAAAKQVMLERVGELAELTTSKGLHYSQFSMRAMNEDYTDLHLNALALFVVRRLRLADVQLTDDLMTLEGRWRQALGRGLVERVQTALSRPPHAFTDYESLAACRLALGPDWQPQDASLSPSTEVVSALSEGTLRANADGLSVYSKASLATLLLLPRDPTRDSSSALAAAVASGVPEQARGILEYLGSSMRVTARTAYVASSKGSWHAADVRGEGMALTAMALAIRAGGVAGVANVDKLANYVGRGGGVECRGVSSLIGAFGLVDYDKATHNDRGNVNFVALAGGTELFRDRLGSGDAAPKDVELASFDSLQGLYGMPLPPVLFEATGVGEVSVALGMRFVPAAVSAQPVYRGIQVEKVVQLQDPVLGGPTGPPLTSVPLGKVVTVTLQITTPDDLHGVLFEDWLPAGLEALDPNLANGGSDDVGLGGCPQFMRFWQCSSFSRETMKDRVRFYSSYLWAGSHTVRFQAIAVTRGEFVLPPGRAKVTTEPEVMGLSAGGSLRVVGPEERSEVAPLPPPPKSCPGDCMGRGTCDTSTGACRCFPGSSGADCSGIAAAPVLSLSASAGVQVISGTAGVDARITVRTSASAGTTALPKWLFATSTALQAVSSTASAELTVRVDPAQQILHLSLPARLQGEYLANVTVVGSVDGTLFGHARVPVVVNPLNAWRDFFDVGHNEHQQEEQQKAHESMKANQILV